MLLLHRIKFCPLIVTINLLLCAIVIGKLTSGAAPVGQQSLPPNSALLSSTQAPQPPMQPHQEIANSMNSPLATAATFSIPPQLNLPTTSMPISHHQQHQSTTERPQTPSPITTIVVSSTTPSHITTTTTQPPSSFSSLLVTKPVSTLPPGLESFDSQIQGRSQAQIITTSTTSAPITTTSPSLFDDIPFTTFSPESTTFRSNTSFEDASMESLDGPQHGTATLGTNSHPERPNFEDSPNSFMETSEEKRSQPLQNTFAQTTPAPPTTPQNSQPNSVPISSLPINSANSSQPQNINLNLTSSPLPATQDNTSSSNDTPRSSDLREVSNHDEPTSIGQQSRSSSEDRSQSVSQIKPSTPIPQSPSISNNSLEKKVQILKPKSKFTCSKNSDCNEGVCSNSRCFCSSGYTGDSCNINIDDCRQFDGTPCLNNGTCIDGEGEFSCECLPGFRGDRCQDLADMCNDSPCYNNAECINHRTNYTCKCAPGWTGRQCEINIDDCAKSPCLNGGNCHDLVDNFKCECPIGFSGATCGINVDDCVPDPCQNNATCRDLINDYECLCQPGYSGKHCEEDIDECLSRPRPCSLHGDCIDQVNGFKCNCHDGWTGQHCENDINECDSSRPVCLNGGTCINLDGSHQCSCREGYTGKKCSEISDYCKAKQPCGKHGICKNLNSGKNQFQCECYSSYVGNRCERKRECALHECNFEHAHCVNNVTCACLPGRREERIMCEYVTSCEQVDGDLCLHGGVCKDFESGGYQCACQDPWYGSVCQFRAESQFDAVLLVVVTCVGFLVAACAVVSLVIFRSVRKARATRGTYSPSTQEKHGNSASDLMKPPNLERLI